MKPLLFALCVVFASRDLRAQTPAWQPSPGHTQAAIWPGAVPDQLTSQPPPTFLVQVENNPVDDVANSLAYFAALKKAGDHQNDSEVIRI
jgi:hypothetical protein